MKQSLQISRLLAATALACGLLAVAHVSAAQDYDLVINNGRFRAFHLRCAAVSMSSRSANHKSA